MNFIITDNLVYNRQILVTILRGCINRNRKLKTKETKSLNNDDLRQSTEAQRKKHIKSFYKSDVCRAINNKLKAFSMQIMFSALHCSQ